MTQFCPGSESINKTGATLAIIVSSILQARKCGQLVSNSMSYTF